MLDSVGGDGVDSHICDMFETSWEVASLCPEPFEMLIHHHLVESKWVLS